MHHSIPAEHAQHDLDLIAGHAASDLSDSDQTRADALLRSCTSCADLRRDLVAIASATRSLPALVSPYDYQLSEAQAASLRRSGWIKSLLRPFAAPGSAVRPLAMAFTSLGLAGLLVTNILPALLGGFGSAGALAPAPQAGAGGGLPRSTAAAAPAASSAAAMSEAPGLVPVSGGPQATNRQDDNLFGSLGQPTAGTAGEGSKANEGDSGAEVAQGAATGQPYAADRLSAVERTLAAEESNPVVVGSLILLAVGLALLGLRFIARRVR